MPSVGMLAGEFLRQAAWSCNCCAQSRGRERRASKAGNWPHWQVDGRARAPASEIPTSESPGFVFFCFVFLSCSRSLDFVFYHGLITPDELFTLCKLRLCDKVVPVFYSVCREYKYLSKFFEKTSACLQRGVN